MRVGWFEVLRFGLDFGGLLVWFQIGGVSLDFCSGN